MEFFFQREGAEDLSQEEEYNFPMNSSSIILCLSAYVYVYGLKKLSPIIIYWFLWNFVNPRKIVNPQKYL